MLQQLPVTSHGRDTLSQEGRKCLLSVPDILRVSVTGGLVDKGKYHRGKYRAVDSRHFFSEGFHSAVVTVLVLVGNKGPRGHSLAPPPTGVGRRVVGKRQKTHGPG